MYRTFIFTLACWAIGTRAQTVIAECTEEALSAAIAKGGLIRMDCDGIINLSTTLKITNAVELDATGRNVVLDGARATRLLEITNTKVTLRNVTLRNGFSRGLSGVATATTKELATDGVGAAAKLVGSQLEIVNCTFSNNTSVGGEGAGYDSMGPLWRQVTGGGDGKGGAIYAENSAVFVHESEFENDSALGSDGVHFTSFSKPFFTPPGSAYGGAIYAKDSTVTILASKFDGCRAGASDTGDSGGAGFMAGGAVAGENCTVQIDESSFVGNFASFTNRGGVARGGALYLWEGRAAIRRSLFASNEVAGSLTYGASSAGGGIWTANQCIVESCSFKSNSVKGGDIRQVGFGNTTTGPAKGGGIASLSSIGITNCTFAFNELYGGLGSRTPMGDTYGGALYLEGEAVISFSTLVTNRLTTTPGAWIGSTGATFGGAIYTTGTNDVTALLEGSVIAGNFPRNFDSLMSVIKDQGGNVSGDDSLAIQSDDTVANIDPKISPMQSYRQYVFFPLTAGSAAINRGEKLRGPIADEVGFTRERSDSGSIEWEGTAAQLRLIQNDTNQLQLRIHDPSYSFHLLEESSDWTVWIPRPLQDFSPISISLDAKQKFFRVR